MLQHNAEHWVPVTDEIVDELYQDYLVWLTLDPEERLHTIALRQYEKDLDALKLANPPEHHAWQDAIEEWELLRSQFELRKMVGLAPFVDEKERIAAAHQKMLTAYDAFDALCPCPTVIWPEDVQERLDRHQQQIAHLHSIEVEWRKTETFTKDENALWWHLCSSSARRPRHFDDTEYAIAYLNAKWQLLDLQRRGAALKVLYDGGWRPFPDGSRLDYFLWDLSEFGVRLEKWRFGLVEWEMWISYVESPSSRRRDDMGLKPRIGPNLMGKNFRNHH